MVSAWASASSLVLGQRKVDQRSNEITAVPPLLDMLDVSGCIVTTDGMGCQRAIAEKVVENDADYVFVVKENQGQLLEAIQGLLDHDDEMRWVACDHHKTVDKGHGRIAIRACWTTSDPAYLAYIAGLGEWKGLQCIGMIEAQRRMGEEWSEKRRYFISSLASNAEQLLAAARS